MSSEKAVVLFSGGMDSAVVAKECWNDGRLPILLFVDYGQNEHESRRIESFRHSRSLYGAGLSLRVLKLPRWTFSEAESAETTWEIRCRNLALLGIAAALAENLGAKHIYTGFNADDLAYPDCQPPFTVMVEGAWRLSVRDLRFVVCPLRRMRKADIVRRGLELGVDFAEAPSCYVPVDGKACGKCASCRERLAGFEEAGVEDPIEYVRHSD